MGVGSRMLALGGVAVVGVLAVSRPARACSFAQTVVFDAESPDAFVGVPPTPTLAVGPITRGGPETDSCSDIGSIALTLGGFESGAGYVFEVRDDSDLPSSGGSMFPREPIVPFEDTSVLPDGALEVDVWFHWLDGAKAEQEPFRLDVRAIPVGTGGMGAPSEWITVSDPGRRSGGCSTSPGAAGTPWVIILVVAGLGCLRRTSARASYQR